MEEHQEKLEEYVDIDSDGYEDYVLPAKLSLKSRRRYAKAKQVFEMGLWATDINLLKGVELTTKGEHRNTWQELRQDNKDLRKKMRREGILAEDCFCGEYSPKSHLLHLHGFYRLREPMSSAKLHSLLSEYWGVIHGAPIVWVQDLWDAQGLMNYSVKHALKNFESFEHSDGSRMRLLKSKHWLPPGWRRVCKVLVKWALDHGANWRYDDDLDSWQETWGREYVAFAWDVIKDYLWRWCNGEVVILEFYHYGVVIQGDSIEYFERGTDYEIK